MQQRLVTTENLGAWLVKCNADFSDIARRDAGSRIERWCVRPGYRSELMARGHRVVLWVGGSRGRLVRGVWGVGHLAGAARREPIPPAAGAADNPPPTGQRWYVPLELRLLPEPARVARERLRADGRLSGLEVFRQPQAANPSYLTTAQLAALQDYVSWPVTPGQS